MTVRTGERDAGRRAAQDIRRSCAPGAHFLAIETCILIESNREKRHGLRKYSCGDEPTSDVKESATMENEPCATEQAMRDARRTMVDYTKGIELRGRTEGRTTGLRRPGVDRRYFIRLVGTV